MSNPWQWRAGVLATALALATAWPAKAKEEFTLAVYPYLTAEAVVENFAPLAEYLRAQTGTAVRLSVSASYADHLHRIGQGEFDLAYLSASLYVAAVEEIGPLPLLARVEINSKKTMRGAIVAKSNAPMRTLADLKRKTIAFGPLESTMGYWMPRYTLMDAGVLPLLAGEEVLSHHESVAFSVLLGQFDAGALREDVYERYKERGLRVLAWTPEITGQLFIANPALDEDSLHRLRVALLNLSQHDVEKKILSALLPQATALAPVEDCDYDALRTMMRQVREKGAH